MNSDPEVMRFVGDGRMPDPVELERRTRERVDTDFGMGLGYWSVFPRERPDDYLGYVVLSPVPDSPISNCPTASGGTLGARLRHRGLQGRTRVRFPGPWVAGNRRADLSRQLRSQRVIAKLGFQPAGNRHAYGTDLLFYRLARELLLGVQEPESRRSRLSTR